MWFASKFETVRHRTKQVLHRWDFLSLVLLTVAFSALWGFIEIADEVREGQLQRIDSQILHLFRDPSDPGNPIGSRQVEETVRDITALGGFPILILLFVSAVTVLWLERRHRAAVWLSVAGLGAALLSTLFKGLFQRGRPTLIETQLLPESYSFPSGHAMLSAATYFTIAALLVHVVPRKRTRAFILGIAFVLTVAVGVSRIYLGVHYPSDVLAGWAVGVGWAAVCWFAAWRVRARGKLSRPQ